MSYGSVSDARTVDQRDKEVQDRVRRIETRLTKLLRHLGLDEQGSMPYYDDNRACIEVPSISVALKDVVAAIPPHDEAHVAVRHKDVLICYITKGAV